MHKNKNLTYIARGIGRNLAYHRRRVGMSQREVAEIAHIHRTEVSALERGLRVPRADLLFRLAHIVGVGPADLLAGMAWIPPDVSETGEGYFRFEEPRR